MPVSSHDVRRVIERTDLRLLVHELTGRHINGRPVRCPLPDHPKSDPRLESSFQVHDAHEGDLWNCPLCGTGSAIDLVVRHDRASYAEAIDWLASRLAPGTMKPEPPRPQQPKAAQRNGPSRRGSRKNGTPSQRQVAPAGGRRGKRGRRRRSAAR